MGDRREHRVLLLTRQNLNLPIQIAPITTNSEISCHRQWPTLIQHDAKLPYSQENLQKGQTLAWFQADHKTAEPNPNRTTQ